MTRTSNRRKKQMFPFGYLMIPVVGFVGIGLLFFGIKIFFAPETKDPYATYVKQEEVKSPKTPPTVMEDESSSVPVEEMVAVPVVKDGDSPSMKPASPQPTSKPKTPQTQVRPQTAPAKPSPSTPVGAAWAVQVGSFKQKSMADSLASEIRGKGFKPTVGSGEVGGTVYYRVLLSGGNSRAEAESLGQRLKSMGYPYFVFPKK